MTAYTKAVLTVTHFWPKNFNLTSLKTYKLLNSSHHKLCKSLTTVYVPHVQTTVTLKQKAKMDKISLNRNTQCKYAIKEGVHRDAVICTYIYVYVT